MKRSEPEPEVPETNDNVEEKGLYGDHEPQIKVSLVSEGDDPELEGVRLCIVDHSCLKDSEFFLKPGQVRSVFQNRNQYKALYIIEESEQGKMALVEILGDSLLDLTQKLEKETRPIVMVFYHLVNRQLILLTSPAGMICLDYPNLEKFGDNTLTLVFQGFFSGSFTDYPQLEYLTTFFRYEIDNYNKIPVANRRFNKTDAPSQ